MGVRKEKKDAQKTGPSGRAIIGWGAGSLMVLGLAVFGALAWTEVRGTRKVVQDWASPYHPDPKSIPAFSPTFLTAGKSRLLE